VTALPFFMPGTPGPGTPLPGSPTPPALAGELGAILPLAPMPTAGLPGFALVFEGLVPAGSHLRTAPGLATLVPRPETGEGPATPEGEEPTAPLLSDLTTLPLVGDQPVASPLPAMVPQSMPDAALAPAPTAQPAPATPVLTPTHPAAVALTTAQMTAPPAEGRPIPSLGPSPGLPGQEPPPAPEAAPLSEPSRDKPVQTVPTPLSPVAVTELSATEPMSTPDRMLAEPCGPEAPTESRRSSDPVSHAHRAGVEGQTPPERQIVTAVTTSASGRTEILLDPQDLGRVRVSLDGNDGALVVTIEAEKPETIDLLRRNADILIEEFRDAGYTSLSFNFAGRGNDAQGAFTAQTPLDPETPPPTMAEPIPLSAPAGAGIGLTSLDLRL